MKVLYVKLTDGYRDDFTYQENILPAKFIKLGHETHIFVSRRTRDDSGKRILTNPGVYQNDSGVWIHVIPFCHRFDRLGRKLDIYDSLYNEICKLNPDFIFVHGLQFYSVKDIAKYKKIHSEVTVVVDNHADYIIMPLDTLKRKIIQKIYYKYLAQKINPYVQHFYGVSPLRAQYLNEVYGIPQNKIGIITQGGDEEIIDSLDAAEIRKELQCRFNISNEKVIIVSGAGNIDRKKKLYELMYAVLNNSSFELILFGTFTDDERQKCLSLLNATNIHYLGRIPGSDSYKYFKAADIAIFPGQHSVFWDQVVACGTPLVVRKIKGMDYFNINGNCLYLKSGTTKEISEVLHYLEDRQHLRILKQNAQTEAKVKFSYINIAKQIFDDKRRMHETKRVL